MLIYSKKLYKKETVTIVNEFKENVAGHQTTSTVRIKRY